MDGENNGKPYEQMDDLGVPLFLETPIFGNSIGGSNRGSLGVWQTTRGSRPKTEA